MSSAGGEVRSAPDRSSRTWLPDAALALTLLTDQSFGPRKLLSAALVLGGLGVVRMSGP